VLKLSDLIAALEGASNRLIDVEELSERELELLYARYRHLAATAAKLTVGARTTVEDETGECVPHRSRRGRPRLKGQPTEMDLPFSLG